MCYKIPTKYARAEGGCSLTHSARTPPARANQNKFLILFSDLIEIEKK